MQILRETLTECRHCSRYHIKRIFSKKPQNFLDLQYGLWVEFLFTQSLGAVYTKCV